MATYYLIARLDGTRTAGRGNHKVDLSDALERGVTYFVPNEEPPEEEAAEAQPTGLLLHPEPVQTGLGIADDMTLTLGIDGRFRLFRLQAVPTPEHFEPASDVGRHAIISREFIVKAEEPDWWAYGPNGQHVSGLLGAIEALDREEIASLGDKVGDAGLDLFALRQRALGSADAEIAGHDRLGAARLARGYARAATFRSWERNTALSQVASLVGDIAHVLVVGDMLGSDLIDDLAAQLRPFVPELMPEGENRPYPKPGQFDDEDDDREKDADEDEAAEAEAEPAKPRGRAQKAAPAKAQTTTAQSSAAQSAATE